MTYAQGTTVSVGKSRAQIEDVLGKYKASSIGVMLDPGRARVAFKIGHWAVLFKMPLPTEAEALKRKNGRGYYLSKAQRWKWLDAENRRRWRALLLTIKAKLVSIESGVESFEEAFLAHLVLPGTDGATVADGVLPELRAGRSPFRQLPSGVPP